MPIDVRGAKVRVVSVHTSITSHWRDKSRLSAIHSPCNSAGFSRPLWFKWKSAAERGARLIPELSHLSVAFTSGAPVSGYSQIRSPSQEEAVLTAQFN